MTEEELTALVQLICGDEIFFTRQITMKKGVATNILRAHRVTAASMGNPPRGFKETKGRSRAEAMEEMVRVILPWADMMARFNARTRQGVLR